MNKKTKTSELLLMKYMKNKKLFVIESHDQLYKNFKFQSYITAQIDQNN